MKTVPLPTILILIFMVLKLTEHITWSWWWVLSPLWIGVVLYSIGAGADWYLCKTNPNYALRKALKRYGGML